MQNKIDLIYIDPPFDSKADYKSKITLKSGELQSKPSILEQYAYSDTWSEGTKSYLEMLTPRLMLMRELLSERGSIYVHCDWHCGHYIKIIMDCIFGRENFRNEIVWHYKSFAGQTSRYYPRKHDTIFYYTKTQEAIFYQLRQTKDLEDMVDFKNWGKYIVNSNEIRGNYYPGDVRFKRNVDKWKKQNPNREPTKDDILYVFQSQPQDDCFLDIDYLDPKNKTEKLNYLTQKPEALLERIIKASSNEDSIVADFFCGSGTTLSVAHKLGRKFIGSDMGKPAIMITRKRLLDLGCEFEIKSIGEYSKKSKNIGELSQIILSLYVSESGELPYSPKDKHIGILKDSKVLIYVDSPNKITNESTIKECEALRQSYLGQEYKEVILLGWNYSLSINQILSLYPKIKPQVIPPDVLDKLKNKNNYKDLVGKIRFSSLQYLSIKPIRLESKGSDNMDILSIELDNYVLVSPSAIPVDKKEQREKIIEIMNNNPLSLIEYWSVDVDYDGEVFRSVWQDFRGGRESLEVMKSVSLNVPRKVKRKVCVKSVDIFGFEAMVVQEVESRLNGDKNE